MSAPFRISPVICISGEARVSSPTMTNRKLMQRALRQMTRASLAGLEAIAEGDYANARHYRAVFNQEWADAIGYASKCGRKRPEDRP